MSVYRATKYESATAEVIAILSSVAEGYGAEETGDCESPVGFIALVVLDPARCDLDFSDHTNYPLGDYAGEVAREYDVTAEDVTGAHIVTTNSQGFVAVETFATAKAAREEFFCRAGRYAAWDDDPCGESEIYVCPVDGHGYHEV